jgi:hypothetical protein
MDGMPVAIGGGASSTSQWPVCRMLDVRLDRLVLAPVEAAPTSPAMAMAARQY